jgi:hypothetical protein
MLLELLRALPLLSGQLLTQMAFQFFQCFG